MNNMKLISKIIVVLYLCIFPFCLPACGKKTPSPEEITKNSFSAGPAKIREFNELLFASADISSDRGDYLLGPGDLLEIKVFESDKLNATVRISSRGEVSLPLVGELNLKGQTAAEAESLIENRYRETYIRNPNVSVFVKEHYSQRVTVVGQVKNPGTYDYPSRLRLLDAIVLAGGLTEKAGNEINIRRLSSMTEGGDASQQTIAVDMDQLINEGRAELNININGGDIILIPEAGIFYVDGAVRRPGEYRIRNKMTLMDAVLSAGGLAGYANPNNLILMRKHENNSREELQIDLENMDVVEQAMIMDGDIIYVNSSFWGKLLHGGGINVGYLGTGFSFRDPER